MNKYIRNLFLSSKIDWLEKQAYLSLRKKLKKRHFMLQSDARFRLYPSSEPIVKFGPFCNMKYLDDTVWGSIVPKWLGSYESELWGVMQWIIDFKYDTIFDVGCAEGYYAVGLALNCPNANIYAYDIDPISRSQCLNLWKLNESRGRLKILKKCTSKEFLQKSKGKTLIVCDIEGAELDLLNPEDSRSLINSDILVEIHKTSHTVEENSSILLKRFNKTHEATLIESNSQQIPLIISQTLNISPDIIKKYTSEGRPYIQNWLFLKSHYLHRKL